MKFTAQTERDEGNYSAEFAAKTRRPFRMSAFVLRPFTAFSSRTIFYIILHSAEKVNCLRGKFPRGAPAFFRKNFEESYVFGCASSAVFEGSSSDMGASDAAMLRLLFLCTRSEVRRMTRESGL